MQVVQAAEGPACNAVGVMCHWQCSGGVGEAGVHAVGHDDHNIDMIPQSHSAFSRATKKVCTKATARRTAGTVEWWDRTKCQHRFDKCLGEKQYCFQKNNMRDVPLLRLSWFSPPAENSKSATNRFGSSDSSGLLSRFSLDIHLDPSNSWLNGASGNGRPASNASARKEQFLKHFFMPGQEKFVKWKLGIKKIHGNALHANWNTWYFAQKFQGRQSGNGAQQFSFKISPGR